MLQIVNNQQTLAVLQIDFDQDLLEQERPDGYPVTYTINWLRPIESSFFAKPIHGEGCFKVGKRRFTIFLSKQTEGDGPRAIDFDLTKPLGKGGMVGEVQYRGFELESIGEVFAREDLVRLNFHLLEVGQHSAQ